MKGKIVFILLITVCLLSCSANAQTPSPKKAMKTNSTMSVSDIEKHIIDLDNQYQHAVKINDAATMERILADDFVLVTGHGKAFTKEDLLKDARAGKTKYEHQEDTQQTVRVWGDTAVITALLWEKGTNEDGSRFDKKLWFSDVYKRTPEGWRYVFAQSSIPLPDLP